MRRRTDGEVVEGTAAAADPAAANSQSRILRGGVLVWLSTDHKVDPHAHGLEARQAGITASKTQRQVTDWYTCLKQCALYSGTEGVSSTPSVRKKLVIKMDKKECI